MSVAVASISVVIPVHNGEKYLAASIQSVLDQRHPDLEVLVVDNASTDASASVVAAFPSVRCLRLERKGVSRALNHGIAHSQGSFLAFLDADDLWAPHKLTAQLDVFLREPATDIVFGQVRQFVSPELDDAARAKLDVREEVMPGRVRGSLLIRRDSFDRVGPFEVDTNFAEFIDWYMRAQDAGLREVMIPEVLMLRRIHGGNMSFTEQARRVDYVRVLKRGLDRRRRGAE